MCANCQKLNKPMYYLRKLTRTTDLCYALLRAFPRLCGGFQEGSGKIGTRWTVPEHQTPHGMLGNLLYPLNVQTVAVPKPRKILLPQKARGVMGNTSTRLLTAAPRRLQREWAVCVSVCMWVCVCTWRGCLWNLKGHITLAVAPKNQQRQSGEPHPGLEALEVQQIAFWN